ncbi:AraC family transcriptional regulator [Spongiibacter sp. KMU-158]|uniref:AraC family transcriptional regulator n=1 Tax=Spongiibacter pelagi TaxID=2760804 RepID=A0A927C1B6_9GAMM|nr:AraC family transcriptional regulator [Spongiibacter pelagi]MBD2859455.1 AraC family transcriptional regulator [Spongiibacter pelagi]
MRAGITAHHIKGFRPSLNAMRGLGFEAELCLVGTGLTETDLDRDDASCTWEQELRFNENLLALSKDPCLGLVLAEAYPLPIYGLVGYALLSAPTFRHALAIIESYIDLTYTVCDFRFEITGDTASLILRDKFPIPAKLKSMLVDRDLACCAAALSECLGQTIDLTEVRLTHNGFNHARRYEDFFACPVRFNENETRLSFDVKLLDRALPMRDSQASQLFDQQCQLMLSRLSKQGDFIEAIRQKILAKPGHSFPDVETVAEQMAISVRTLRRRLAEEGTSYRTILDDIRYDLAKDYLSQSRLSLDMISELLGYNDAASFSHAFKRWSNQTPSGWRRANAD